MRRSLRLIFEHAKRDVLASSDPSFTHSSSPESRSSRAKAASSTAVVLIGETLWGSRRASSGATSIYDDPRR